MGFALTTLANLKAWKSISTTTDDVLMQRLISQISLATLNYLERPALVRTTNTELRDGVGNQRMVLRNWPVVKISSLVVGRTTIPAAPALVVGTPGTSNYIGSSGNGYALQTWDGTSPGNPQPLTLVGYRFDRGYSNVQIIYDAGYCVTGEQQTIPPSGVYNVTPMTPGTWAQDDGVTYTSSGIKLTPVASNPVQGQYVPPNPFATQLPGSYYVFSAADAGQGITLNYSFIPAALEEAVIEWIWERYTYKNRIGQISQSVNGSETASFSQKDMPDFIKTVFDGYKKFLPL